MITVGLEDWRKELIQTGNIVQDDDDSISQKEAKDRLNRYVELLEMVEGDESQHVFQAIVDSIQAENDYGAYESTYNALWKFSPEKFARYFVSALPGFIQRYGEESGRFLLALTGWGREVYLPHFNRELAEAPAEGLSTILSYIKQQEKDGWFEDTRGLIRPKRNALQGV
jgi:hypothetical protein